MKTNFKRTKKEVAEWKRRQIPIDAILENAKTDGDVKFAKIAQAESDNMLRKVFYEDTKEFNSWENVSIVDIKFIFKCASK